MDIDKILSLLKKCELPTENDIKLLCEKVSDILIKEYNVVNIKSPINICGDIHGQFYDLLEIFEIGGCLEEINYCFLGDYVDRGYHSLETFLYLIILKIKYPNKITILRGNHECRTLTKSYTFYEECHKKYGALNVYKYCTDVFDLLPLCAIINFQFFLVHGGLSPDLLSINRINRIERIKEISDDHRISDLLWSDPEEDILDFCISPRGAGYLFSEKNVDQFNHINQIDCILRSHQLCNNGYKYMFNEKLITVWSAPNYCYSCGNLGAILQIDDEMKKEFIVFEESPLNKELKYKRCLVQPSYFL